VAVKVSNAADGLLGSDVVQGLLGFDAVQVDGAWAPSALLYSG